MFHLFCDVTHLLVGLYMCISHLAFKLFAHLESFNYIFKNTFKQHFNKLQNVLFLRQKVVTFEFCKNGYVEQFELLFNNFGT